MKDLHADCEFKLFSEYAQLFLEGKKSTTIRYKHGKIRYPAKNLMPIVETRTNTLISFVIVTRAEVRYYGTLTEKDAVRDGFGSLEELKEALESIYGKISSEEPVTIYHISKWQ